MLDLNKQMSDMSEGTSEGTARLTYGSYADRNPTLGKMKTCPFCHKRRREFSLEACCNPSHISVAPDMPKYMLKRFTHKRHSNKTRKQLHDLSIELHDEVFRNTTQLLLEGLVGFWEPPNDIPEAHIPSFAEKMLMKSRKAKASRKRKQQQDSRRINFGLKRGLNG